MEHLRSFGHVVRPRRTMHVVSAFQVMDPSKRTILSAVRPAGVCHLCWYRSVSTSGARVRPNGAGTRLLTASKMSPNQTITPTTYRSNGPRPQARHFSKGGTAPTTIEQHEEEVKKVAASVKGFYERGEKFRMFHASSNSTRMSAMGRDPRKVVDVSRLNHVVSVDVQRRTALVEPNVPMDRLVEETLKYGLVPPVVMEFPGITAGGGFNGTSGESSSFKHGFFNETMNKVEMVLANGEIITASATQNADLFKGAAGAVGTLGVTTIVELQLIPAKKFVETTYHPVSNMQEAVSTLQDFTSRPEDFDYIDGVMFSKTSGAIVTGRMTDQPAPELPVQRFSAASDPWFFMHAQDCISKRPGPTTEAIPLPEYLFRYDRGGFWVGVSAFKYFAGVPFNKFTRWFLDDFLHTRMLYKALHASTRSERMLIQDLALPYSTALKFLEEVDNQLGIWPLWLCPLKQSEHPTMHPHCKEYESDGKTLKQMLNIGLWGRTGSKTIQEYLEKNRALEKTLQEHRGMRWLYAQTYHPEEEFWNDFDKVWYDALRTKYHATTLPNVYDKVKVDLDAEIESRENAPFTKRLMAYPPFDGVYGLRKAIQSKAYLDARNSTWKDWVPRK